MNRHDFFDIALLVLIVLFSSLYSNITRDVSKKEIKSLELEISFLKHELDSIKYTTSNRNDTLVINFYDKSIKAKQIKK